MPAELKALADHRNVFNILPAQLEQFQGWTNKTWIKVNNLSCCTLKLGYNEYNGYNEQISRANWLF